ncbi:integral membrane protein [Xylariaceae sp. FL0804]|nr:integral membrane protein [Xylariaceae sp. FL0804]
MASHLETTRSDLPPPSPATPSSSSTTSSPSLSSSLSSALYSAMPGETGPILGAVSLPVAMVIAGFFALAIYNSVEVFFFIFTRFRPQRGRRGLYFWSLLAANTGIPLHATAALLRFFALAPSLPMCVLIDVGWWLMVTGQALVLYGRLHLVVGDPRKLRWALAAIAAAFVALQLPTSALFLAANVDAEGNGLVDVARRGRVVRAFNVLEKTQLATYAVLETALSGLYVYEAGSVLKPMEITKGPRVRTLFRQLVGLFVLVAVLDITLLVCQYTDHFQIQTTYKPVVYSIKLKVESVVLNNLIALIQSGTCCCRNWTGDPIQLSGNVPLRGCLTGNALTEDSWWAQHKASMGFGLTRTRSSTARRESVASAESRRPRSPIRFLSI